MRAASPGNGRSWRMDSGVFCVTALVVSKNEAPATPAESRRKSLRSTHIVSSGPPVFIEKAGQRNPARITVVRRRGDLHYRIVGQLRRLPRVIEIVELAESEAAVQHDVFFRVQGIGIYQDGDMRRHGIAIIPYRQALSRPFHRQLIGDARQEPVTARIAPQNQVARSDLGVGDLLILAYL